MDIKTTEEVDGNLNITVELDIERKPQICIQKDVLHVLDFGYTTYLFQIYKILGWVNLSITGSSASYDALIPLPQALSEAVYII